MSDDVLSRFLRYVRVNTQSSYDTGSTPSTSGQWDLLRMLESELRQMGASDVSLNEYGYLMATLPATSDRAGVPTVAFLAHVDTTPDFSGEGVKPIVHRKWKGKPIVLPDDNTQVLDPAQNGTLAAARGKDIVTASGRTVLGADDKAGVVVVMSLAAHLLAHPAIKHGTIRVCFNPDEEIGRGVEKLDLDELGANVAYTLDGEHPGEVVWETFSADEASVVIEGVSTHPGDARKHGMVNAVQVAARLLAALPRENFSPETTDGRQGYLHPSRIEGNAEKVKLRFILRDHELEGLASTGARLKGLVQGIQASEPRARLACEITSQYRNMGYWLRKDMRPVELAYDAVRAVGLEPSSPAARGGTDGSRLTERGLPTPNLFCGGHNAHGPLEWVAVQDMQLAVDTCVELARLWHEKGAGYKGRRLKKARKAARANGWRS
jgi:tripeptide aminopeptidase